MSKATPEKIPGTDQAWDSGELGTSEEHAKPAAANLQDEIDIRLGL